jgi:hypothetical protein
MGWTWLEEALDEEERAETGEGAEDSLEDGDLSELDEDDDDEEMLPDPAREGIDWVHDDEERFIHPVQKGAKDALYALMDELKARGQFPECEDNDLGEFLGHCMNLSAKLAGALSPIARFDYQPEPGFTIALLKRALEILNDALASAETLSAKPEVFPPTSLEKYRVALLATREDILALITRLRG